MYPPKQIRPVLSVITGFAAAEAEDRAYWWSRSALERWQAVELTRQLHHGPDCAAGRPQRVLEVTRRPGVEYLLVGGYAVGHHGYPRYTVDIDVWVPIDIGNAERLTPVLRDLGFDMPEFDPELLLRERMIVRMGVPPTRIEITNHIDGVEFPVCYARRVVAEIDRVPVNIIALDDPKVNKRASGRLKDLAGAAAPPTSGM